MFNALQKQAQQVSEYHKQVLLLEGEVRARLLELAPHDGELKRALGLHLRCFGVVAVHKSRGAAQVAADDAGEHGGITMP